MTAEERAASVAAVRESVRDALRKLTEQPADAVGTDADHDEAVAVTIGDRPRQSE